MIKTLVLGTATMALLSGCMFMGGTGTRSFAFRHNPTTADANAAGSAQAMTRADGMVQTTLMLTGLTPNKAYVAHYHAFGPASNTDPCASNGPVTVGFPNFSADANGQATVSVTSEASRIAGDLGAYINVHTADDLSVVPLCAPIKMTKG